MANQIGLSSPPMFHPFQLLQMLHQLLPPLAPPAAATVTFSHEDFEHLLKIAHGDPPMPSASLANAGISVNESIPFN